MKEPKVESDIKTQQAHIDSFRELCEYIVSFGHPATSCVWDRSQIERIYERAEQLLEITNPSQ